MKILIVGAGTVGSAICAQLEGEGHDVTVVDRNAHSLEEIEASFDVATVIGNGAEIAVLRRAGADGAELLIAVTSSDEINILCCAAAKKLGTRNTVARVRNPEYAGQLYELKNDFGLSIHLYPSVA